MQNIFLKLRLVFFIWTHNIFAFLTGKLSYQRFSYSLRKQIIISLKFKNSKYSKVGNKIFVDPFVPYFPSSYFKQVLANNSIDTFPLKPNYAQISITNYCPCNCFHCHVKNTYKKDLPKQKILEAIRDIIEMDCPLIFFVGGEPMSRFNDLIDFIKASHEYMDTRIFTSGVGVNVDRLKKLQDAGLNGICVSIDHFKEDIHNKQRKNDEAFESATRTIEEASKIGFYVSAVCCTTSSMVKSGEVFKVVDFVESLHAHSIQINAIRPVGVALEAGNPNLFLSKEDKDNLINYYKEQNSTNRNISIVMPWYNEEPYNFGCTATSGQKVYIDAQGNVQPCELLKASIGNINERTLKEIWTTFLPHCGHPVTECIVYPLNELIKKAKVLPLDKETTYKVWPEMCNLEATELFKRVRRKNT
ncbi:radical SAM/SPASM domain-containing protein [Candidatus Latescibacterota bacterium]